MATIVPNIANQRFIRPVEVRGDAAAFTFNPPTATAETPPEVVPGSGMYCDDPQQLMALVKQNLASAPDRWMSALALYVCELQRQEGSLAVAPGRTAAASSAGGSPQVSPAQAVAAREKLARLRPMVQELLASGTVAQPTAPEAASALYALARAVNIPAGQISVVAGKNATTRLLVEVVKPETVGQLGGDVFAVTDRGSAIDRVSAFYRGTAGVSAAADMKIAPAVIAMVREKLQLIGGFNGDDAEIRNLIASFASAKPGSAVAALRQLEVGSPEIVPRLQRVLRQYTAEALRYEKPLTEAQQATRVLSLLFGTDSGLRAVQTQVMRNDLTAQSKRLETLIDEHADEAVWDMVIVGAMGPHGGAAIDRVVQTNPEQRVLGIDANVVSANYGAQGASFYLNSRNGQDDGRPGGNGRGNINPLGGPLLTSDLSGTAHPTPADVEDAAVAGIYNATQRGHVDLLLGNRVEKIEHRSTSTDPDAANWKAAFRVTMANGRVVYAHKAGATNGFGGTPKPFGGPKSNEEFQQALAAQRAATAVWRGAVAAAIVNGEADRPAAPNGRVYLSADVLTVANTPGADALAAFRAPKPEPVRKDEVTASSVVVGFGDSNRTVLELALGLAPDSIYRNTPAQLGQIRDMVWVVGNNGPDDCFEFLVGRDYLSKVLSDEALTELRRVLKGRPVARLFSNTSVVQELRAKLAPADQDALDGARTRYQKISGAILKGLVRLEQAQAESFKNDADNNSVVIKLSNGNSVRACALIDGRGYRAEIGPLAWLTNPKKPNPKQLISETKNLALYTAPVAEGVIGRNDEGLAVVAKTVEGLEDDFAWMGPGNGGDLVSKADIAKQTKVGANTVSLFVNIPRTIASTDRLALGPTRVGSSLTERYSVAAPVAERAERPVATSLRVSFDALLPAEADADSTLEVHARLAAILNRFDLSSFAAGSPIDFSLRKVQGGAFYAVGSTALELASTTLSRRTLDVIGREILSDGRFATLALQMMQDPDVALRVRGKVRDNGQTDVPTSRLEPVDATELAQMVAPTDEDAQRLSRELRYVGSVGISGAKRDAAIAAVNEAIDQNVVATELLDQAQAKYIRKKNVIAEKKKLVAEERQNARIAEARQLAEDIVTGRFILNPDYAVSIRAGVAIGAYDQARAETVIATGMQIARERALSAAFSSLSVKAIFDNLSGQRRITTLLDLVSKGSVLLLGETDKVNAVLDVAEKQGLVTAQQRKAVERSGRVSLQKRARLDLERGYSIASDSQFLSEDTLNDQALQAVRRVNIKLANRELYGDARRQKIEALVRRGVSGTVLPEEQTDELLATRAGVLALFESDYLRQSERQNVRRSGRAALEILGNSRRDRSDDDLILDFATSAIKLNVIEPAELALALKRGRPGALERLGNSLRAVAGRVRGTGA